MEELLSAASEFLDGSETTGGRRLEKGKYESAQNRF